MFFSFLSFISFIFCTTARLPDNKNIKNIHIPSCKSCVHYKPSFIYRDFTHPYNECHKFGEKDIITDKITYSIAENSRNDETKCGKGGIHFEEEPNIHFKILKHAVITNIGYGIVFILVSISLR